jgi:6-pyruvoyltetrahydropterin/6-carboxytetrahydropterin synthase
MSAEHLLGHIWEQVVVEAPSDAPLVELELCATPYLRFRIHRERPEMVLLTQQFEFSAAHRLHCPDFSAEENRRIFGKCNNPSGHGHNYLLEITLAGRPDGETGTVLPLPQFEQIVKERVIDRLDHKHLNEDTPEFRNVNPSVENIAQVIWGMLAEHVGPAELFSVKVWETPKTWAEYRGHHGFGQA